MRILENRVAKLEKLKGGKENSGVVFVTVLRDGTGFFHKGKVFEHLSDLEGETMFIFPENFENPEEWAAAAKVPANQRPDAKQWEEVNKVLASNL
jgi:hypothetical protein